MLEYPSFLHPIAFEIFGLSIRWYGIMYILGFAAGRQILRYLCRQGTLRMHPDRSDDFLVALFIGMLVGARLVYMLVYYRPEAGEESYWYTPLMVWKGGLAFHGGAAGMFAAIWWFSRRFKIRFFNLADALALSCPLGIFFGRLGNFINSELWGRVSDVPWAMRFPVWDFDGKLLGWTEPRHPSQLYEAFGEGFLGLIFIWTIKRYVRYQGELIGWGVCWYAVTRFVVEFFREADEQVGYYGIFTMGQILCVLMLAVGLGLVIVAYRRKLPVNAPAPGGDAEAAPGTAQAV